MSRTRNTSGHVHATTIATARAARHRCARLACGLSHGTLRDLDAWTRYFREAEIPVLASTSRALEVLRADEDNVDASMLAEVIEADPLMTLKLLAHVAGKRRSGTFTETENVTTSLVMTGISPFFNSFGLQPTIEDWLHDQPLALRGLQALLRRAERAAHFAVGFCGAPRRHRRGRDPSGRRSSTILPRC